MKKSIVFSLIILLVLSVSPLFAGGGPPSPTTTTRPADGTPDDTNEGTGWEEPQTSILLPQEDNKLTIEAEIIEIEPKPVDISTFEMLTTSIYHIFLKYGIISL